MPSKIQLDENLWFLYICLQKSDMKSIDFAAVGAATSLKSPAARMRYTRLRRQIESGTLIGTHGTPFASEIVAEKNLEREKVRKRRTKAQMIEDGDRKPSSSACASPSSLPVVVTSERQKPTKMKMEKGVGMVKQGIKRERSASWDSDTYEESSVGSDNDDESPSGDDSEDEMPLAKLRKTRTTTTTPREPGSGSSNANSGVNENENENENEMGPRRGTTHFPFLHGQESASEKAGDDTTERGRGNRDYFSRSPPANRPIISHSPGEPSPSLECPYTIVVAEDQSPPWSSYPRLEEVINEGTRNFTVQNFRNT